MKALTTLLICLACVAPTQAQSSGGAYTLSPTVISGGGGTSTDANNTFRLDGTIGQALTEASRGTSTAGNTYIVYGGFHPAAFGADADVPEILTPTADTWVQGADAFRDTNYGTSPEMQVKRTLNPGAGRGRRGFLRFDTSSITGTILSAKLRIYARLTEESLPPTGMIVQKVIDTTWGETTMTWNNQPLVASPTALAQITVMNATSQYYEFDLTGFIQQERAEGRPIVSFRLINQSPTGISGVSYTVVNSREAASSHPQLVIER
jgi:hypothetical protein